MRSVSETQASVQVLVHHHLAACQRRSPAHPLDLQTEILKAHRVVAVYAAFELQRENPLQITTSAEHKSISPLPGRDLKTAIELGDVIFPQKPVRRLQRPQLAQPQLLRQAALPGREVALAAPTRFGRVGRNHLHAQLVQCPPHLRAAVIIHLAAHLRRQPEMTPPIAVQRAEHAFALDHFLQSRHHRRRRFLFHQLGVVDLTGGIVQNHDQVVPAFVLKPLVAAAVDMQQHSRQRPPLAPLAVSPALASARHQARSLQRLLHPGVTQFDPVLSLQLFVKVLHVQIEILLPVQREHFLHRRHRHPAPRRLAAPPVEQPVVAFFHVALPPAPHVPVADAQDLRRLPPGDLLRHCLQHYVLYFHRPLHRGPRISFHAPHGLLSSPPAKRTYHVLSPPDISCATDTVSSEIFRFFWLRSSMFGIGRACSTTSRNQFLGGKMAISRWSILTIVVFLAAGLTFAQPSQESQAPTPDKHSGMHQGESADQHLQMLSEKLNLTDDQKAKLKPLLQDQMQQMKAVREDSSLSQEQQRAKMKSIHESLHDQINAVLTPEQQAKFKQMRQEQMQKHKGMEEGKTEHQ